MNGRLDTLQAAVLLAKLDVFDAEFAARERVAGIYDLRLGNLLDRPRCLTAQALGRSTPCCCRMAQRGTGCRRR